MKKIKRPEEKPYGGVLDSSEKTIDYVGRWIKYADHLEAKVEVLEKVYEAAKDSLRWVENHDDWNTWFNDLDDAIKEAQKVLERTPN